MNRYARIGPKEKLRMTRDLIKSNNEKIKNIKELLNGYGSTFSPSLLIENIKSILETGKLRHYK